MTLLVGLIAVLLSPAQALGFEQTKTCTESGIYACGPGEAPQAVHWTARCVSYQINEEGSKNFTGSSDEVPDIEELRRAVHYSFAAWTEVGCSDMTLVDGGLTSDSETTYRSDGPNTNLVVWRDEGWSEVASSRAFALTSVTFNPNNGVIADADIEFNSEFYKFSAGPEPQPNHVDLRNTMTHEAGHFIGLDHTDVHEATMFGTAPVGETDKRTLHADDINGVCHVYPSSDRSQSQCESAADFPPGDPLYEDESTTAVCSVGEVGGATPAGVAMVLVALLGLGLIRRQFQ